MDAASPLPASLIATMSISEELPSCPPPPSPAVLPTPARMTLARQTSTEDEISKMLASVTTSKTSSVGSVDDQHEVSMSSVDLVDLEGVLPGGDGELLAAVPQHAAGWETTERSPPMIAPDSPLEPDLGGVAKTIITSPAAAASAGGATKGVDWKVFTETLETDGAIRNGSKIVGLKEANQLLVWNSKLRDMKPVGLSTVRIEGIGPGRMPAHLELCAKGQNEPVAVEQVRTVQAFSVSSFTGLKVERAATDDGTSASRCDLRVTLRIGPYGGYLTEGAETAKGSAQNLGCDRACCFLPTSEIGFTAAQYKSTLGDDEWLIPHAFSATPPRSCSHTFPSSVRTALQGKAAKVEDRQYPFYFVAVLEDRTRVLVEGSFRMQSGTDERMVAMTQQKRRWRKDEVKGSAPGKRQSLASLDTNELKQKKQAASASQRAAATSKRATPTSKRATPTSKRATPTPTRATPTSASLAAAGAGAGAGAVAGAGDVGGIVYTCRCKRCGRPKKQKASSCPCPKTEGSPLMQPQQRVIEESPMKGSSSHRPDYTSKCKHCSMVKKQPRSLCPCNGTGVYPHHMVAMQSSPDPQAGLQVDGSFSAPRTPMQPGSGDDSGGDDASSELFQGTPEAAVAAAAADGAGASGPIFRKMHLDDFSMIQPGPMSQEDMGHSLADLNESADSLAEMEEPGEANAIDMSDSSWDTLIATELETQPFGASVQMR